MEALQILIGITWLIAALAAISYRELYQQQKMYTDYWFKNHERASDNLMKLIYNSENTGGDSAVTKESCDYTNVSPAPITENETETAVESALASTPDGEKFFCRMAYQIAEELEDRCVNQCIECKQNCSTHSERSERCGG